LSDDTDINNMIIDNLSVRVSSLEYKVDRLNAESTDNREDMVSLKDDMKHCRTDMKEMGTDMREMKTKVMKNGKTRKSDWVQIILLVAVTIIATVMGVI